MLVNDYFNQNFSDEKTREISELECWLCSLSSIVPRGMRGGDDLQTDASPRQMRQAFGDFLVGVPDDPRFHDHNGGASGGLGVGNGFDESLGVPQPPNPLPEGRPPPTGEKKFLKKNFDTATKSPTVNLYGSRIANMKMATKNNQTEIIRLI